MITYELGSRVRMKKQHPCGCSIFRVIRVGADIKIECEGCGRVIMLARHEFDKRIKAVIAKEEI